LRKNGPGLQPLYRFPPQPVQASLSITNTRFTRCVRRTPTLACSNGT